MENSARNFVKIVKEICGEEEIALESYAYDWIFRLQKGGVSGYIVGYQFGLNAASVNAICCDKSAASEIMTSLGIPNVEHYFFMSPLQQKYVSRQGNWKRIMELLENHKRLVCKANEGTGGDLVFCVGSQYELESAVFHIFERAQSMAVCPYYDIEKEYRIIVLNGEIKLAFTKQRPCVVGDNIHTVCQLLPESVAGRMDRLDLSGMNPADYSKIPAKGEIFYLNWKHNLGQGSCARIEDTDTVKEEMGDMVSALTDKMNIRFASIDIIQCPDGYRVLEINSGVMMDYFSRQDERAYQTAKSIYREAILSMMN